MGGLSRAERQIARRDAQIQELQTKNKELEGSVEAKAKLMREYKDAMRSKLRKIKKVLWTKAQGSNTKWLRSSLKMEQNKCSRVKTRAALAERSSNVALTMCKRSSKRLETRAALSARASKVSIDMCSKKKDEYKKAAEACSKP